MAAQSSVETHKAAKRHRCLWCWQTIEPGETYSRYRVWDDGDASTVRMHPECHEAMQEEALAEGGWVEWTPGQERPTRPISATDGNISHTPTKGD